jgi:hypothetical protein
MIMMRSVLMQKEVNRLEKAMKKQQKLIADFSVWERKLNHHVQNREWKQMQAVMEEAGKVSEKIDLSEKERLEAFAALRDMLGEGEEAGFYQVVVHLPSKERDSLSSSFRELKMGVINLRGIVWGIDAYVRAVQGTLKDIIGEISPMRRGTLYAGDGIAKNPDAGPLVLNREL